MARRFAFHNVSLSFLLPAKDNKLYFLKNSTDNYNFHQKTKDQMKNK